MGEGRGVRGPLVTAAWLADHLGDPDVCVVDCRFTLGEPDAGRARYLAGHIPGAAFLDLEADLSGPRGGGRHPLPEAAAFTASARRAGVSDEALVVAYDDVMTGGAARLWWLLRHFGHPRATVLDGGLAAWEGPLRAGEEAIAPGRFHAVARTGDMVDAEAVLAGSPGRVLVDARAPERFRGEHEPIDRVPGHIPGARNLPFAGAFPPPADLVEHPGEVVAYCGSGVTATVVLLALAAHGRDDAKLYPGSYSDWVARGLPVEAG